MAGKGMSIVGNLAAPGLMKCLWGVASLTPAAVSASPSRSSVGTVTVPGVALGDVVIGVAGPALSAAGITYVGEVTAADTVTIYALNTGGATPTPAAGTWTVIVLKRGN